MNKKISLYVMIAVIMIQLCVPSGFVFYDSYSSSLIEKNGEEFIISVDTIYPERDGLLIVKDRVNRQKKYFILENHTSGYTMTQWSDTLPENASYIESEIDRYGRYTFPKMHFRCNEKYDLQNITFIKQSTDEKKPPEDGFVFYREAKVKINVYNGRFTVTELYIDDIPSEEFFKQLNNQ